MYVVVRSYSGSGVGELFDLIGNSEAEIKELITGVPGFVSYVASRTGDDTGVTVTVCEDKEGMDESSRRAADWVKENGTSPTDPPSISEGTTVLQF